MSAKAKSCFFFCLFFFEEQALKTAKLAMCVLTVGVETLIGGGRSGAVWSTALQGHE